jgi:uncharacterized protein YidB (DUF937 family)
VLSEVLGSGSQGGLSAIVAKLGRRALTGQILIETPELAITPAVATVLGNDTVKQHRARFNIPIDQLAKVLAQRVPLAVDHASPDGSCRLRQAWREGPPRRLIEFVRTGKLPLSH